MSVIPILMYHNIGVPPDGARLRSLYVRPSAFARQMLMLRVMGYHGMSMRDAMPYLRGEKSGKVAVITFDDGYVDTLEKALPLLQAHHFTATCYAVSGRIGGYNEWDADELGARKPLMNLDQLRAWQAAGMEVGAHTATHVRLSHCDALRLEAEVKDCKAVLEDALGGPVTQFCYPYGDWNERSVEMVREAGFEAATTTLRGRARPGDDLFHLRRVLVGGHNLLHLFIMKLVTDYEDRRGGSDGREDAAGFAAEPGGYHEKSPDLRD